MIVEKVEILFGKLVYGFFPFPLLGRGRINDVINAEACGINLNQILRDVEVLDLCGSILFELFWSFNDKFSWPICFDSFCWAVKIFLYYVK